MKTTPSNQHYLLSSLLMRDKIKLFFIFKPYRKNLFIIKVKIVNIFRRPDLTKIAGIAPGLSAMTDLAKQRKEWD